MTDITSLPIRKIAIVRALKLGDFLVAIPAIRALRAAFPDATIDYVGLPWSKPLTIRYNHYFDGFVEFPGFPSLPERAYDPAHIVRFIDTMQHAAYDLVLQMHGNGRIINVLIELLGARRAAGYACPESYWPNRDLFMAYPERLHETRKHLALMEFLGVSTQGTRLEFPVTDEDIAALRANLGKTLSDYICVHPGSVSGARWPAAHFAAVADELADQGLSVVLTGTKDELPLTQEVSALMQAPALNMAGKTDLGQLAALLQQSRLLIANDTGVAHLAVAIGAPSITVFTSADPSLWAALDQEKHPYLTLGQAAPAAVHQLATTLL